MYIAGKLQGVDKWWNYVVVLDNHMVSLMKHIKTKLSTSHSSYFAHRIFFLLLLLLEGVWGGGRLLRICHLQPEVIYM